MWWGRAGEASKSQAKGPCIFSELSLLEAWLLDKQQSGWVRINDPRRTPAA